MPSERKTAQEMVTAWMDENGALRHSTGDSVLLPLEAIRIAEEYAAQEVARVTAERDEARTSMMDIASVYTFLEEESRIFRARAEKAEAEAERLLRVYKEACLDRDRLNAERTRALELLQIAGELHESDMRARCARGQCVCRFSHYNESLNRLLHPIAIVRPVHENVTEGVSNAIPIPTQPGILRHDQ